MHTVVDTALRAAGLPAEVTRRRDLSGGCIHRVERLELADGRAVVVKLNDASALGIFEAEADGLRALGATGTVMVPEPLAVVAEPGAAALLMTEIAPGPATDGAWVGLGHDLAALHAAGAGAGYGYAIDNHLGATAQPNGREDDWVRFNQEHRLGHQLRLARDGARLERGEARALERLIGRLDEHLPRCPPASLLHGDLWSGNALPALDASGAARVALIDPAVSVGDGWADVAMMKLFGGFPAACFEAYASRRDPVERLDDRLAVYQLYHLLNHVNLFGRGYAGQAMAIVERLG